MSQAGTNQVIIVWGDRLQNVQQGDWLFDHLIRAANQACRVKKIALFDIGERPLKLERGAFHEEFRSLVNYDKGGFVFVEKILRQLLKREQFICPQVALIVGSALARQQRFS